MYSLKKYICGIERLLDKYDMTIETEIAALTAATSALTATVNVEKTALDQAVSQSQAAANASAAMTGLVTSTWRRFPTMCRLIMNGTGTITFDARNKAGTILVSVASFTITSAVNQIAFPFFGDTAYEIRATLTGSATVEVM